ncbi:hypothetical protein K431DRAFT_235977 [Polychaeton citri CBS 116435]|uniref:Amino acid transporter transmembrane domain-containing protein n=1 Tax=Polychaeton citri CBS 116435 TaxID=1314669 RepID=A0A9P4PWC8_9PEZI|nr:hypothetical protein K431DRAFT_235977 [Polychaeton citri CBS 116435]
MASYAAIHSSPNEHGSSRAGSVASGAPSSSRHSGRRHRKDHGVEGNASWISSVVNLLNTIVGAGVLAMPKALSNMGVLLGVVVILWSALASGFGLYLQTQCARFLDKGGASFFALSQITYPNASVIFDGAIAIKCFGVGVSYLIIIGDLMPGVVQGFSSDVGGSEFLLMRQFWITAFMVFLIPLSFLKRLDSLKYTSFVALVSIAYLIVLVVYHFAARDTLDERGAVHWVQPGSFTSVLQVFPVIVFAYTCHQNMFSILNEIKNPTQFRTTSVVTTSIGSAASIYCLVAITGYLSFGDNILGNIVAQYIPSVASTIGRLAIVILVGLSYPLQVHPCRASLDAVSRWRPARRRTQEYTPASGSPSRNSLLGHGGNKIPAGSKPEEMSELRFAIITTFVIIMSYIVAMTVSSLDKVLAYVGSTGSTSISFILPGLFYYKISAPDSPHQQRLIKEDDDEEYEGSGGAGSSSDDDAASPVEGRAGPSSWRSVIGGKSRSRAWRREMLRKCSLALAVYGLLVMVVCLVTNTFFIAGSH